MLTPYSLNECCIFPYRTQMNTFVYLTGVSQTVMKCQCDIGKGLHRIHFEKKNLQNQAVQMDFCDKCSDKNTVHIEMYS